MISNSRCMCCLFLPGAAMVYLYELAHSRHKGVTGSVGYISLGAGVVLGILVVNAVISLVPNGELTADAILQRYCSTLAVLHSSLLPWRCLNCSK
jgi:hypothetical protein